MSVLPAKGSLYRVSEKGIEIAPDRASLFTCCSRLHLLLW